MSEKKLVLVLSVLFQPDVRICARLLADLTLRILYFVRMPILSGRRVLEICQGTGESRDGHGNSLVGGLSQKPTRDFASRQGIV